jgi:hypothetical protein
MVVFLFGVLRSVVTTLYPGKKATASASVQLLSSSVMKLGSLSGVPIWISMHGYRMPPR